MIKYTLLFLISSTFYQYTLLDTVNITMYYESLCPACEEFIPTQLYPSYQKLGDNLVFDFVPYGNAKRKLVDGKWMFECQHGINECNGNKIQGCVLKHYSDTPTQINFLVCLTNTTTLTNSTTLTNTTSDDDHTGKKCAEENNMEWNKIVQCIEGPEGDEVMLNNAIRTEAVKDLRYVPWFVTDGNQDEDFQASIRENLTETVCGMLKEKPKACYEE